MKKLIIVVKNPENNKEKEKLDFLIKLTDDLIEESNEKMCITIHRITEKETEDFLIVPYSILKINDNKQKEFGYEPIFKLIKNLIYDAFAHRLGKALIYIVNSQIKNNNIKNYEGINHLRCYVDEIERNIKYFDHFKFDNINFKSEKPGADGFIEYLLELVTNKSCTAISK